jgi:ethanolamine utilization protein EutN
MQLAKIVGQLVSTIKEPGLDSFKILLVQDVDPASPDDSSDSASYLAVDLVGAGEGEVVVVANGSAARVNGASSHTATDSAVVAIVDSVIVGGQTTFKK